MDLGVKDKVILITGGSTGIGAATALAFAKEGSKVAICARSKENVGKVVDKAKSEGLDIYGEALDITDEDRYRAFVENVADKFGGINMLFNNAGTGGSTYLMQETKENWNKLLDLNLTAVWVGCQLVVPYLKAAGGGSIVSTTSLSARISTTKRGIYAITKAGVSSMTTLLASELAKDNIRVNAVAPGVIMSEMLAHSLNTDPNYSADFISRTAIMQRIGGPEEIASAVLFLCSNMASYITGEVLDVSGGKFRVQDPWCSWEGK